MEKNKTTILFIILSILLYVGSIIFFPIGIFAFLAPLIALKDFKHPLKVKFFDFAILLALLTCTITIALVQNAEWVAALTYGSLVWVAFVFYNFSNTHLKTNIGIFTFLIFWLAMEYMALLLDANVAPFLLGSALADSSLVSWSGYSGMIGVSCWILFGNILLYLVFFKGENNILTGNFRWLSLSYSLVAIALPIIIASILDFEMVTISAQTVKQLYTDQRVTTLPYAQNGEIFGRTATWVSVLIIIYAFVKRKIK